MENGGTPGAASAFKTLIEELFEGPGEQDGMFLSRGTGIYATLKAIDSDAASVLVKDNSVAAHAGHMLLYLEVLGAYLRGEVRTANWNEGWKHTSVNEKEWESLKTAIRDACDSAVKNSGRVVGWDGDRITMAMALIIHSAYHLGAIRQIVKHL